MKWYPPPMVGLLPVLILAAVLPFARPLDHGACLVSHNEEWIEMIYTGESWISIPQTDAVRDQWQYPNGRPKQ